MFQRPRLFRLLFVEKVRVEDCSFKFIYVSTTSSNQWLRSAGEHLSLPYMTDVKNRFYNK